MYNLRNFAAEMKSKSHILILLLVSMMITYVGAGQLVAQCRHTGMVEAVDAHDSCNLPFGISCLTTISSRKSA